MDHQSFKKKVYSNSLASSMQKWLTIYEIKLLRQPSKSPEQNCRVSRGEQNLKEDKDKTRLSIKILKLYWIRKIAFLSDKGSCTKYKVWESKNCATRTFLRYLIFDHESFFLNKLEIKFELVYDVVYIFTIGSNNSV